MEEAQIRDDIGDSTPKKSDGAANTAVVTTNKGASNIVEEPDLNFKPTEQQPAGISTFHKPKEPSEKDTDFNIQEQSKTIVPDSEDDNDEEDDENDEDEEYRLGMLNSVVISSWEELQEQKKVRNKLPGTFVSEDGCRHSTFCTNCHTINWSSDFSNCIGCQYPNIRIHSCSEMNHASNDRNEGVFCRIHRLWYDPTYKACIKCEPSELEFPDMPDIKEIRTTKSISQKESLQFHVARNMSARRHPYVTPSDHLQVSHIGVQEINIKELEFMDRSFDDEDMVSVPSINARTNRVKLLSERFSATMTSMTRPDLQKPNSTSAWGLAKWVAHFNRGPFPEPKFFCEDYLTHYFDEEKEHWDRVILPDDHEKNYKLLKNELNARGTVIHALLQMLNFLTVPIASQVSDKDPYTNDADRYLINQEIYAFHGLPREQQSILITQYIHANHVNQKNCDRFNQLCFSEKGEGGPKDRQKIIDEVTKGIKANLKIAEDTNRQLENEKAQLNHDLTKANSQMTELQAQITQLQTSNKTMTDELAELNKKSLPSTKKQKTKMSYLLQLLKENGIGISKEEWNAYEKKTEAKYELNSSKFPPFVFSENKPATTEGAANKADVPPAEVHVLNWQQRNQKHLHQNAFSDTEDSYISEGDTSYTEERQRRAVQMHPLDLDQDPAIHRTPGMDLKEALLIAQTPSTDIQVAAQDLQRMQQIVERTRPRVSLKLSDVPKQKDKQNLAEWGRSLYDVVKKSNWTVDDFRLVMSSHVNPTYSYQMNSSFDEAVKKSIERIEIPTPSILLAQMIHDDMLTRPMEAVTTRKQLNDLKQGNSTPQELFARIRKLEEKGAIKLSESEMFNYFTNALNRDLYAKIMESEITTFAEALKKANLVWSINQTLNPGKGSKNNQKSDKNEDSKASYYCEKHGENRSHDTKDCRGKGKGKNKSQKKEINNLESDDIHSKTAEKFKQMQKEINELRSKDKDSKSQNKDDSKKKRKKRTPEEEKTYFESKNKEDFENLPTMKQWKDKKDSGELDDDRVCRFCKSSKHVVSECNKLKTYRELLKKYELVDIVAITVNKEKVSPYFFMDVQGKDKIKQHQFMIDSGAEMSVVPLKFAKEFGLTLEATNIKIHGAGGGQTTMDYITAIPIVINDVTYHVPSLVSRNKYFDNKSILGRQFFSETDISVRIGDDNEWVMLQHTPQGTITLSKPKRKQIKQLHVLSRGKGDNY